MYLSLKLLSQWLNLILDPSKSHNSPSLLPIGLGPTLPPLKMTTQISNTDTPDPFMIKYNSTYILTFTTGNHIELWRSPLLHDFHDNVAAKRVIWYPPFPLQVIDV